MEWITYILVFLAFCFVWFLITRLWVGGIDMIISLFKKLFHSNKKESAGTGNWHSLEEVRDKNKEDEIEK